VFAEGLAPEIKLMMMMNDDNKPSDDVSRQVTAMFSLILAASLIHKNVRQNVAGNTLAAYFKQLGQCHSILSPP